jgi:hypothetical protein
MCSAVGVQRWKVDWLRHTYCSMHICAFMNPNLTAMHMHSKESQDIIYRHYFRRILVQDAKAFWQYYPNSSV